MEQNPWNRDDEIPQISASFEACFMTFLLVLLTFLAVVVPLFGKSPERCCTKAPFPADDGSQTIELSHGATRYGVFLFTFE
jgi:hypothetical protein